MACIRFGSLRRNKARLERPGEVAKPSLDKAVEEPRLESFSSVTPLNNALDSGRHDMSEIPSDENDKETKIDLEAAIRAVNVALTGLEIGGKRQSPTPPRPETAPANQGPTRSRPGFPPKAVLPRAIRRFAKFVTPQQRQFQDALTMQQQGMQLPYQQQRPSPSDFLLNSGELLNAQLNGYFPNGMDMRSNYSEPDMQSLWSNPSSDGWNLHQLQSLINSQQGFSAQNGVGRHLSADFSGGHHVNKYAMDNAIAEFLMNSSDSFSSKIEVPKHGNSRGDSFSSKIEFPVNCDSFTSKLSAREDSFSSQPYWNRGVEPPVDALMDTAFSIPESIVQELECMAEGDVAKETPEISDDLQLDPHSRSEQAILASITGTLKSALEGTLCDDDLASNLNSLTIAVRRHLMEFQTFSSSAAEKFLLMGSTLPIVCRTAMFSEHIISLLKRFMDIISSGHRMLNNASVCVAPAANIDPQKQSEARHLLTNIHRSLTVGQQGDGTQQPVAYTSHDSADAASSDAGVKSAAAEPIVPENSNPSSDTADSQLRNDHVAQSS